jgi:hypothetical protein
MPAEQGARRWRALGGVLGPAAFIAAWSMLGATQDGYSPIEDPISRLAAVGAPTRGAMTAGLLAFSAGVGLYADELHKSISKPGAAALATTALATVGVAATPLDSALGGVPHAAFAGLSYASLAATPILGGRALVRAGRPKAGVLSIAVGLGSAAALAGSVLVPQVSGLLQRVGLTAGDTWIMASAVGLLRRCR